jgi:ParB family transcriptional regulator, chromosome partitioning protein
MPENTTDSINKTKRGLGRGLGSLLGGAEASGDESQVVENKNLQTKTESHVPIDEQARVWNIQIDKLKAGQYQPRKNFEKSALEGLAQSIKENGILQPIVARKTSSGQLEIVAGERRWRAAQAAGLHEVPVIIKKYENQKTLELAIIENIQREDLSPLEEADAYLKLTQEFYLTQQQIAEKVGKDRATVANAIRVLSLPAEIKKLISDKSLSVGHAKALLSVSDVLLQKELAQRSVNEALSVRALERLISTASLKKTSFEKDVKSSSIEQLVGALAEDLQKKLVSKVKIDYSAGKGQIKIAFYSDEELNNLVEVIRSGCTKK